MENIHVRRYSEPPVGGQHPIVGTVEPEDRSWILFVRRGRCPMLFVRLDTPGPDGALYVPAIDASAA